MAESCAKIKAITMAARFIIFRQALKPQTPAGFILRGFVLKN
jgi:hypothetical protein